jgi:small subunit ribosomal protein S24e
MSDKFVLYARKQLNNPLLGRRQLQVELIHPESGSISREQIKEKLSTMFKVKTETISIFGLHSKFGGGRSTGFAFIYNNLDDRKKYDMKKNLLREKLFEKGKKTRKQKKEIKGRVNKVRGTAKTVAAGATKKKK